MSVLLPPVLVVDDEKNMRLSLQTVLKDEDYATRLVESAEEALQAAGARGVFHGHHRCPARRHERL